MPRWFTCSTSRMASPGHRLADYRIVTFVGGFAFGDHLGAGFVFANRIRWRLYDQLVELIERGGLALGICNGFQTMVRLGMVPGFDGDYRTPRATLAPNDRLGLLGQLGPAEGRSGVTLRLDPRHRRDRPADPPRRRQAPDRIPEVLERLEKGHQVAVRYVDERASPPRNGRPTPTGHRVRWPGSATRRAASSA